MGKIKTNKEFEEIAVLIEEARNRAFHKVNEELVLLYFNVGKIVSAKVEAGSWGENTVGELAEFIQGNYSGYSGFTRRGLYRMKQFYEVYSSDEFVSPIATQLEALFSGNQQSPKMSALPSQNTKANNGDEKVPALPTQLEVIKNQLVTLLLSKVTWTNHLEILSKAKSAEKNSFTCFIALKNVGQ